MSPRSYRLHIRLKRSCRLPVGRFGTFDFPAGNYVYTGSTRRSIESRIRRHLRREKKLRWHTDYLLAAPSAEITFIERSDCPECEPNQGGAGDAYPALAPAIA